MTQSPEPATSWPSEPAFPRRYAAAMKKLLILVILIALGSIAAKKVREL